MKKRLFDKHNIPTPEGAQLCLAVEDTLRPLFAEWIAQGYSVPEIEPIAHAAIYGIMAEMDVRTKTVRKRQR